METQRLVDQLRGALGPGDIRVVVVAEGVLRGVVRQHRGAVVEPAARSVLEIVCDRASVFETAVAGLVAIPLDLVAGNCRGSIREIHQHAQAGVYPHRVALRRRSGPASGPRLFKLLRTVVVAALLPARCETSAGS